MYHGTVYKALRVLSELAWTVAFSNEPITPRSLRPHCILHYGFAALALRDGRQVS